MFRNRYWREYPMWMQVMLFGLMIFTLLSFFTVIAYVLVPQITGIPLADIASLDKTSPARLKDAALLAQALSAAGIFLAPALLFSYMTHPRPAEYLGLRKPGKPIHWLLVIVIMLGAIPVLLGLEGLFRQITLWGGMKDMQNKTDKIIEAFLTIHSFGDFLKTFAVLAVLPAVSEELLFRGVVMRMIHSRTQKIGLALAFTSLIFAFVHYNPVGLIAIFLAALLLGGIYYLTGSLWLSMLAHLMNNGIQVVVIYMGNSNPAIKSFVEGDYIPWQWPVIGLVVFAASFYLLWKYRTPLPDDWSDNFRGEEREKNNWDLFRKNEDEPDQLN